MDKNQLREEIIQSLIPILDEIVTKDEELNMIKFQFYPPAAKIAAVFSKNQEERAQELVEMIEKEKRFRKFIEDQGATVADFVNNFLQKFEENRNKMEELKIDPETAFPALFRLTFNDKFADSSPEEKRKILQEFLISLEQYMSFK